MFKSPLLGKVEEKPYLESPGTNPNMSTALSVCDGLLLAVASVTNLPLPCLEWFSKSLCSSLPPFSGCPPQDKAPTSQPLDRYTTHCPAPHLLSRSPSPGALGFIQTQDLWGSQVSTLCCFLCVNQHPHPPLSGNFLLTLHDLVQIFAKLKIVGYKTLRTSWFFYCC